MLNIFIPLVLVFGLFISILDIKIGLIRNRYILLLFVAGTIYHVSIGTLSNPAPVFYTLFYGLFIVLLLWWIGFWPGGDAKYFWIMLLFFPYDFYSKNLVMSLLFYTFVPVFVFMIAYIVYRSNLSALRNAVAYTIKPYRIIYIFVILLGFMWLFSEMLSLAGVSADYFITILILFVVFELMSVSRSHVTELAMILLILIRGVLDPFSLISIQNILNLISLVAGFLFLRFFLLHISYYSSTERISIKDLRPGMSPAQGIEKTEDGYSLVSFLNSSLIEYLQQKRKKFIHSLDELGNNDIGIIKSLRKKGELKFSGIRIYQTQPFALFIFIGYLLTLFIGTSLF